MPKTIVTGPTGTAITLAEAKAHLNLDFSEDDPLVNAYVEAATKAVEQYIGSPLRTETHKYHFAQWELVLILNDARIQSITNVKYFDTAGDEQTVTPGGNYATDLVSIQRKVIFFPSASLPTVSEVLAFPISVTVVTGFTTLPENVKLAVKTLVATYYTHRESETLTDGTPVHLYSLFKFLLNPYRVKLI